MKSKRLAAVLLVLGLVISCTGVFAEGGSSIPAASSETVAKLLEVIDFKFFVKEDGIGKGSAPVYTAPSEDSIRLADGKAGCNVESEIAVAGHVNGWLLVRYEIGNKNTKDRQVRVGYIPPKYSKGYKSGRGDIVFDSIPVKLAEDTEITDNPRHNSTWFGTLKEGTDITILGKYTYTGNWWYIETTLDGKLTRGFINRNATAILVDGIKYHNNEELGFPAVSPANTQKVGMITVRGTKDDAMIVRQKASKDSKMVARVFGGESYPCYGTEEPRKGHSWHYIWVDGVWGWIAAGNATLAADE